MNPDAHVPACARRPPALAPSPWIHTGRVPGRYLTPAGTQGFAPHYDDIEAFILQVEGRKRWRLYNNPSGETLPRFSSGNFEQEEIGEVILDITLEPGDLLYFPRGVVHQGVAPEEGAEHSHHLTISAYQQNDWMSYLSKVRKGTLQPPL